MSGFHLIWADPGAYFLEPRTDDRFSKADDGERGEHIASATEEAIDDGHTDPENARR